ncbi:MAG: hypothetical protein R3B45_11720 [Bdellovibrionota bacterium]
MKMYFDICFKFSIILLSFYSSVTNICFGMSVFDFEYQPVVITESDGNIDPSLQNKVVKLYLDSVRKVILKNLARNIYGTGLQEEKIGEMNKPVSDVATIFKEIDRELESKIKQELGDSLKALVSSDWFNLKFHLAWTNRRQDLGTQSANFPGVDVVNLFWPLVQKNLFDNSSNTKSEMLRWAFSIPVVRAEDLSGGAASIRDKSIDAYRYFAKLKPNKFIPILSTFYLRITRGSLYYEFSSAFKPKDLQIELLPPESADVLLAKHLEWTPPQTVNAPAVVRLSIFRRYTTILEKEQIRPTFTIKFGRALRGDVDSIFVCQKTCDLAYDEKPIHILRSAPTVVAKIRWPSTDFTDPSLGVKQSFVEWINKYTNLYVMLNDLSFDISEFDKPTLIESKSQVPLIVNFRVPVIGTSSFLDVTKEERWGLDIFKKLVNSKASYKLDKSLFGKIDGPNERVNLQTKSIIDQLLGAML